jgi:tRNA pseudouridine13 synthase
VKVKATPADFVVEEEGGPELSDRPLPYAVFELSKTSWDTFDLVDLLSRTWNVPRDGISLGGIKDRHGRTAQRISVRGLDRRPAPIREKNFSATFLGWSAAPISARDIRGNRFRIVLRDLTPGETALIAANAEEISRHGFPNYFDTQRFGSARHGAGFMGKEIFLGRREKALRLYFTPSKHDDRRTREMKRCVLESWNRWEKCAGLGFWEYGRVLAVLAEHRGAYHKALASIDRRFLVLVLNAYQSFLFNGLLARWLSEIGGLAGVTLVPLRSPFGVLQLYHSLPAAAAADVMSAVLPVPGYDTECADPRVRRLLAEVLAEEQVELSHLRVRQMRGIRVGGVDRRAVVVPEGLAVSPGEPDDLYPGRQKVALSFFLPRGAYATMLVKRLLLAPAR